MQASCKLLASQACRLVLDKLQSMHAELTQIRNVQIFYASVWMCETATEYSMYCKCVSKLDDVSMPLVCLTCVNINCYRL